nr:hypothetical protein [Tanacetum cinerariifolium]
AGADFTKIQNRVLVQAQRFGKLVARRRRAVEETLAKNLALVGARQRRRLVVAPLQLHRHLVENSGLQARKIADDAPRCVALQGAARHGIIEANKVRILENQAQVVHCLVAVIFYRIAQRERAAQLVLPEVFAESCRRINRRDAVLVHGFGDAPVLVVDLRGAHGAHRYRVRGSPIGARVGAQRQPFHGCKA